MHDARLEDQLRRQLRSEVDSLPFSITAEDLDRTLAVRRRNRMVRRGWLAAAAAAVVLVVGLGAILGLRGKDQPSVSVSPSPSGTPSASPAAVGPAWLAITGPADWQPDPGYEMQVNGKAWVVDKNNGGGVTTVDLANPSRVTISGVGGCESILAFTAQPGRMYVIRFAANGSPAVEDWTANGVDSGPGINGPVTPKCPAAAADTIDTPRPPSEATPQSVRPTEPLGAAHDAVFVRLVGPTDRPDQLTVSIVTLDAAAFETKPSQRIIARIPGSAIPAGLRLNSRDALYAQAGWLALDVADTTKLDRSILIVDLRAPDHATWLVAGNLSVASWGPGSILAVPENSQIHLYNPDGQTVDSVQIPDGVNIADPDARPAWLAAGTGFLTWKGDIEREIGRLDLGGAFTAVTEPPATFQASGLERRWGPDGSELGGGCPTEGGAPGCSISTSLNGGPPIEWYAEGSGKGTIQDSAWDAAGKGVWLLLERGTGRGPKTHVVLHADAPGDWLEIAGMPLTRPSDSSLKFQGLQDAAATLDGRHILIGVASAEVQAAVSGDGARATIDPGAWFAGWADDQGPYPVR